MIYLGLYECKKYKKFIVNLKLWKKSDFQVKILGFKHFFSHYFLINISEPVGSNRRYYYFIDVQKIRARSNESFFRYLAQKFEKCYFENNAFKVSINKNPSLLFSLLHRALSLYPRPGGRCKFQ